MATFQAAEREKVGGRSSIVRKLGKKENWEADLSLRKTLK